MSQKEKSEKKVALVLKRKGGKKYFSSWGARTESSHDADQRDRSHRSLQRGRSSTEKKRGSEQQTMEKRSVI